MCTTVGNTVGGLGHESSHCTGGQQARLDILWAGGAGGGAYPQTTVSGNLFYEAIFFSRESDTNLLQETHAQRHESREMVRSSTVQYLDLILFSALFPLPPQSLYFPQKIKLQPLPSRKYGRKILRVKLLHMHFFTMVLSCFLKKFLLNINNYFKIYIYIFINNR